MSRFARIAVFLGACLSLCAALSSSASAVTWHNSGSTTLHATTAALTLSSTGAGMACPTGGTMTGTVAATPAVIPVGPWAAVTGTMTWTGCTLFSSGVGVDCAYTFTAASFALNVTSGVADVTCNVFLVGTKFCHIEGTLDGHYTNPVAPLTPGTLTLTTGGNLKITNGATGTCPLGNGDIGHLSETTATLTSAAASPVITPTG